MYRLRRRTPCIGAICAGRRGKHRGRNGVGRLTTSRVWRTICISGVAIYEIGRNGNVVTVDRGVWIVSSTYDVHWGRRYDALTVVICVIVTRVSSIVHMYSLEYIGEDPHKQRFMCYLSRFTFGILVLVTADNRVQIFVGWEGVGVCSYLLINFWFTRLQANKAAIKAIVVNRVGDVGRARGIRRRYLKYGSRDYGRVFARAGTYEINLWRDRSIGLRRFVGAVGKSAQRGLHTWLPDAIEGPTPVSALIHAATIVTAGVFRRARCSPRMEHLPYVRNIVTRVGGITARYAGTVGLVQNDRKRVIAYSTCSQLGYIVLACGLSAYEVAVFHLSNHARFKALLFLSAGSVIHARGDEQDIRRIGGLGKRRPLTYSIIRIGSVALIGFPFRTGYYSKDVIIEVAYGSYGIEGHIGHWLGRGAAYCTGFYSLRLRERTFRGEVGGYRKVYEGVHDAPLRIGRPRRILGGGSVYGGWRTKDRRIGRGTPYWGQALYTYESSKYMIEAEFRTSDIKRIPVFIGRLGGGIARFLYETKRRGEFSWRYQVKVSNKERYTFRSKKWYFDKVYTERLAVTTRKEGYVSTYKARDRGCIELIGPSGRTQTIIERGEAVVARQSGEIYEYVGWIVYGRVGRITRSFILITGEYRIVYDTVRNGRVLTCRVYVFIPTQNHH